MMKRLTTAVLLCFSLTGFAQVAEVGGMLGASYYIGDLNPTKHYDQFGIAGGGVFRYNLNTRQALRASLLYGTVSAYDSLSKSETQINRNLHFQSNILEFSVILEINFFHYEIGNKNHPFSPYLFGGLAYFHMNPKAELNGEMVKLQPLGTEGQGTSLYPDRKPYKLNQIAIPFGLGIKANLSELWAINLEWGFRKTYTDYLDDVSTTYADPDVLVDENGDLAAILADRSLAAEGVAGDNANVQRGDSGKLDWYSFSGIMLTYRLGGRPSDCPKFK